MLRNAPLGTKLMLSFLATVLVSVGAIAVLANASAARHFRDYVSVSTRPWVAAAEPAAANHYADAGSWDGIGPVLEAEFSRGSRRGAQQGRGVQPLLADADGRVVYASSTEGLGERVSADDLSRAQAIRLDGVVIGYLMAVSGSREQAFIDSLQRSIVVAGLGAGVGALILGALLTRQMLRPVHSLRDATQRLARGDLSHRVSVTSGDEIGDLAHQFNEMAATLQENESQRQRMMADISHELRTPLAVMRGQVEALLDGVFDLSRDNVVPIHDAVLLLGRLVEDLRDLALADAGRLGLERGEVHIDQLVRRVSSAFQHAAQEKGLTLEEDVAESMPSIEGDSQRLEQVLGNLLSNAIRYTPPGGHILTRAWLDGDRVAFSVRDDGPGIAQEDLERIFDRFYRTDRARSRTTDRTRSTGSGLGLAIAKRLVDEHGGEIIVQSEEGRGSVFAVRLPMRTDAT